MARRDGFCTPLITSVGVSASMSVLEKFIK
jgi:hypothetical protein